MVIIGSIVKSDVTGMAAYMHYEAVRAAQANGVADEDYYNELDRELEKRLKEIETDFAKIDGGFEWDITTLENADGEKRRVAYRKNPDYNSSSLQQPKYFMRDKIDGVTLELLVKHLDAKSK